MTSWRRRKKINHRTYLRTKTKNNRRLRYLKSKRIRGSEVFYEKVFLENSQNSQENTCARVSFLNKVTG